jgi:hypothetical protein
MDYPTRYRLNAAECLSAASRCPSLSRPAILRCRELGRTRPSGGDDARSIGELGHGGSRL